MTRLLLITLQAIAFASVTFASASAQDNCTMISASNTGTVETRIIDGFEYTADSWDRTALLSCARETVYDSCAPLEAASECQKTTSECIDYREGQCARYRETYVCNNAEVDESEIELIDSSFTVIRDEVEDMCTALDAETNCVPLGEQCIEGPETRMINGAPIYKECWKTEKTYSCAADASVSTCDSLREDETCQPIGETCLQELPDGTCGHTEENYKCGGVTGELDPDGGNPSCGVVEVCVGDNCESYEDEPNTDFSRAAAYLNMLDEAAKDFQDNRIFHGEDNRCRKWPLGVLNCCSDSGLLPSIGLNICNEEEVALVDKVEAGVTHYVGTYCSQKAAFVCIEKKRVYCAFGSKFGRIVHQQGREQLSLPWTYDDKASNPLCAGFTPEELAQIDFEELDLSEVYGDMLAKAGADIEATSDRISQDIADFQSGGFTGTVEDPQASDAVYDGLEEPDNGDDVEYETRQLACGADEHGQIIEERSFNVSSSGARTLRAGWSVKSNSCKTIQIEQETRDCSGGWTGQVTEERTFVIRDNGYKLVVNPWSEIENSCYRDVPEQRETACLPPLLGQIEEIRYVRTYQTGATDSATPWQEDGPGCYTIETEDREVSCPFEYTGEVYEQREYRLYESGATSDYSAWEKIGNSCLKPGEETETAACDAGFEGSIVRQRSFEERLNGQRINFSSWATISNSCKAVFYNHRLASCDPGFDGEVAERQRYYVHQDGYEFDFGAWEVEIVDCSRSGIEEQTLSCPAPFTGAYYQERHWSQDQGRPVAYHIWETVQDDCLRRQSETRVADCNAGYIGRLDQRREFDLYRDGRRANYSSWETTNSTCERGGVQTRTVSCPAPWSGTQGETRSYTQLQGQDPVYTPWAMETDNCTRIVTETRTVGCGDGYIGATEQGRTYRLHRVDGGQDQFSPWTDISSTCTRTGVETQTVNCPAPWAGNFVQERSFSQLEGQAPVYAPWVTISDGCNQTLTESRTVACTSGYVGATTETRTYRDNRVGPNTNYSGWAFESTTCTTTGFEERPGVCPATFPDGERTERRNYTQLQGQSRVYSGAWYIYTQSCRRLREGSERRWQDCVGYIPDATGGRVREERSEWIYLDRRPNEPAGPWEIVTFVCQYTNEPGD